jgi:hypothetical protein
MKRRDFDPQFFLILSPSLCYTRLFNLSVLLTAILILISAKLAQKLTLIRIYLKILLNPEYLYFILIYSTALQTQLYRFYVYISEEDCADM